MQKANQQSIFIRLLALFLAVAMLLQGTVTAFALDKEQGVDTGSSGGSGSGGGGYNYASGDWTCKSFLNGI